MTRGSMLEVLRADYMRTAKAKGLGEGEVVVKHGLRNAMLPVITLIGIDLGTVIGVAVLTEFTFDWPGLGSEIVTAVDQRDLPVLLGLTLAVVVAYGLILPLEVLEAPEKGCLNLHGSLLPRWRGAAPIQRAIMAGDARTAVSIMAMEEGLDTGPVGLVEEIPIAPDMTAGELHDEMMRRGADLMGRALSALERDALDFTPQPETGVTYAAKIEKAESRIDFSQPAQEVHNHIRGLSPFPGAWFEMELGGKPTRIKALRSMLAEGQGAPGTVLDGLTIACGTGAVRLKQVQREGKGAMDAEAFLRGAGDLAGTKVG
jgi:methionyl-tRNA formyltransferase